MTQNHTKKKTLGEIIGSKIADISHSNIFFPRTKETKEKINKWDYIKLKNFAQLKKTSSK